MKISSTSYTIVLRCLYPLFQNQCPLFLLYPLFWKLSQSSGQDQQNGKQTYCRLPPYSFTINFKDTLSYFSGLNISMESKNWTCSFSLMLQYNTLPQVFIITPQAEGNYPFLSNSVFWRSIFSPAERCGRIMELKKLPKLNLRGGYWSQVLISSTIFATLTFLVSVLLCHNLVTSMLKCEGSLT